MAVKAHVNTWSETLIDKTHQYKNTWFTFFTCVRSFVRARVHVRVSYLYETEYLCAVVPGCQPDLVAVLSHSPTAGWTADWHRLWKREPPPPVAVCICIYQTGRQPSTYPFNVYPMHYLSYEHAQKEQGSTPPSNHAASMTGALCLNKSSLNNYCRPIITWSTNVFWRHLQWPFHAPVTHQMEQPPAAASGMSLCKCLRVQRCTPLLSIQNVYK